MFEDNTEALHMVNAQQPTRCTCHMDTKYFALQDWVGNDQVELTQIGTANNISDAFTKALGRKKQMSSWDNV
jgi:hypothetical protein